MTQGKPPSPIADGTVPQVQVAYAGENQGTVMLRSPVTGRSCRFGKNSGHRIQYVRVDDLPFLLSLPHFRVLEQTRIDPIQRRIDEAIDARLAQLT